MFVKQIFAREAKLALTTSNFQRVTIRPIDPRRLHSIVFVVNKRGSPFKTPGSFSSYLAKIFRENLGFHCTMNEMRHALVENFRSSKDSSDVQLAESLARVCKHSLRLRYRYTTEEVSTKERNALWTILINQQLTP